MRQSVLRTASAMVLALGACDVVGGGGMVTDGNGPGIAATSADDTCGAEASQGLVGTSVGELQAASLPENRRIIFPGMAVTMDFQPERINVEIGTDDRIARVFCG
jgi:hypothetical protein